MELFFCCVGPPLSPSVILQQEGAALGELINSLGSGARLLVLKSWPLCFLCDPGQVFKLHASASPSVKWRENSIRPMRELQYKEYMSLRVERAWNWDWAKSVSACRLVHVERCVWGAGGYASALDHVRCLYGRGQEEDRAECPAGPGVRTTVALFPLPLPASPCPAGMWGWLSSPPEARLQRLSVQRPLQ